MKIALAAGTYERFVFGYNWENDNLKKSFSVAAHQGPVKCAAAAGHFLASGGNDDAIRVYNLKSGKDLGSLVQHEGSVTCMNFYTPTDEKLAGGMPTHLLSGSEDRSICVWRVGNWAHIRTLTGHKATVNDVAVHPSGMLAVSVSRDKSLRLWDLSAGKLAARVHLKEHGEASRVQFSSDGEEYLLCAEKRVSVFSAEECEELIQLNHPRLVTCFSQLQTSESQVVSGSEDGSLRGWDTSTGEVTFHLPEAHKSRVRGLVTLPTSGGEPGHLFASGSSDGVVRVWDVRALGNKVEPVAEMNSTARVTCLVACNWKSSRGAHKMENTGVKVPTTDQNVDLEPQGDSKRQRKVKK
eukprot:CAMPEP_0196575640 /NCGR_PEP_ID=MMETSP1081-20130531/5072_1 /TAXON_ID=36882 /ORGANISM="Pyramimonas amylifera, Strain CCMP720" /LENGTH=352 /DNA_ID=CAMNT_0041894001 /DNA_START=245 /DNA_END=1303 /DNA_ORIENTATION=-